MWESSADRGYLKPVYWMSNQGSRVDRKEKWPGDCEPEAYHHLEDGEMKRYRWKRLKEEQPAKWKKNEVSLSSWKLSEPSISSWRKGQMIEK